MKQFTFKSIKTRLTFWFLILTLIPLVFVLFVTYIQQVNEMEHDTFEKLTTIRDLKVSNLNNWLTEKERDITAISERGEFTKLKEIFKKKHLQQNDIEVLENCNRIINAYLKRFPEYSEIFIINAQTGGIELSTNKNNIGINKSKNLYFTKPLQTQKLYIKGIYSSKENESSTQMAFSTPIFDTKSNASQIIGILVVQFDLENSLFKRLLQRTGLGKTGEALLVNHEGFVLNKLRWYKNAPLELQITTEPAIKASQGNTGITISTDYRGEKVLAAYTYIPRTGWGFVNKQDLKELYAPIRKIIWNFVLLFIVTSIVIVILAFSISKSISKPIVEIDKVAQKIGAGDFTVRNSIFLEDELGSLATEFNKMTDIIEAQLKIEKGVASVSEAMIGKYSLQKFGSNLLKQLMSNTNTTMSVFYILNKTTSKFEHLASIGANKELVKTFNAKNPEGEISNAISEKNIYYLQNIPENTIFNFKTTAGNAIPKEIITIPIMDNNTVVALISLVSIHAFSKECYAILKQSWGSINTSYSNLIANEKTEILAENLLKSNQKLEFQTEELQIQTTELQNTTEELKEQNIELEMQKIELDEANRLKTTFLSNMSHELRTPLNSVIALSGVLNRKLRNQIPKEEHSYLSIIERNGKHLLTLINDILDISRIEAGREEIVVTKFNVNTVISDFVLMLQPQAKNKNIKLLQKNKNSKLIVSSDIGKYQKILQNLIGNAVKFTQKGKVEISAKKINNTISITVTDTGIGISKKEIPYVFDQFHQADNSTSRKFEGTGLGLAIAKKYVNLLGGSISVKSTLGKGSEFTLTLPIKNKIKELEIANLDKLTPIQIQEKVNSNIATKSILLVEDNESAIIQIKDFLEETGCKILIARNGSEALKIIKNTVIDGIILDLMMPEIDGFSVLKTLRETKATAHIPVLILTAKHITKSELQFLKQNNIHQLIQKGNIKRKKLLHSVIEMVFPKTMVSNKNTEYPTLKIKNTKEKPVVLVVEDNPDNMKTINAMLSTEYTVVEATDGLEGVKMAKKYVPNLILMDIALPKMNGFEAFKKIKEISKLQHIPIIAVTASAMVKDRKKIIAHGFNAYISKPIDQHLFFKTITETLYEK